MRTISTKKENGIITITTETKRFMRRSKIRIFRSQRESPKGYWLWIEMPHKLLVNDTTSFQLDAWARDES